MALNFNPSLYPAPRTIDADQMVLSPLRQALDSYVKLKSQNSEDRYRDLLGKLAQAREARESQQSAYEYGTPANASPLTPANGLTMDQQFRTTLSPNSAPYSMGGANAPMPQVMPQQDAYPGVPAGPNREAPMTSGLVDQFRQWQNQRRSQAQDYSGIGLTPNDVRGAVGDISGLSDIGEKRREALLKFAKAKRETTDEKGPAEAAYYKARADYYANGGPGRGRAGLAGVTYANLVAQRNQLLRQKELAIPGSPEESDAQAQIEDIDQELSARRGKQPKADVSSHPNAAAPAPVAKPKPMLGGNYKSPDDVKAAVKSGKLSRARGLSILRSQFGFQ